jgi:hypothetical protein
MDLGVRRADKPPNPHQMVATALNALYPRGDHAQLLKHQIPKDKAWAPEVNTYNSFVMTQDERFQLKPGVLEYTVVILPHPLAELKQVSVWGNVTRDQLKWASEKKDARITRRMCTLPHGTPMQLAAPEVKAPLVSVRSWRIPNGSLDWKLNTDELGVAEIEMNQQTMERILLARFRNWQVAWSLRKTDHKATALRQLNPTEAKSLYLVDKDDIFAEFHSFAFVMAVTALADRIRFPIWTELANLLVELELSLLRLRLATSFYDDKHTCHLYCISGSELAKRPFYAEILDRVKDPLPMEAIRLFKTDPEVDGLEFDAKTGIVNIKPNVWLNKVYGEEAKDMFLVVPFEQCLSLVAKRQVYLLGGKAFMPMSRGRRCVVDYTHERLKICMAQGIQQSRKGKSGPWADARARDLIGLVWRALQKFRPGGSATIAKDTNVTSVDDYIKFMKERAPACMRLMHNIHIPNRTRLYFINFTSQLGIPSRLVLQVWRRPFDARYGAKAEKERKGLEGEFKWGATTGTRFQATCNSIVKCGRCPFVKGEASGLTAEARNACSKEQGLTGDGQFALKPILRVKHVQVVQ